MARHANNRPGAHFSGGPSKATTPSSQGLRATSPGNTGMSTRAARVTQSATPRTKAQRAADARGNGPHKAPLIVGLVALGVVVAVGLFVAFVIVPGMSSSGSAVASGQEVTVVIPEGSGGTAIAQALKNAGVITSSDDFYKEVQKQNADQKLKSGTYTFVTGATVSEVVKQLVSGPNSSSAKLTIAEGLTLAKTAAAVESALGIPASDFLAQAKASTYVTDYPFLSAAQNDSLEGFLYPKTYDFSGKDVTADSVIRAMLTQYQTEVASLDFATAESTIQSRYSLTMSNYQILTLASIIEKEAVTNDDRPLVSSVFYNRLARNMALQSDATMGYVTGGEVTAQDLQTASPYNTYLNTGLPPTPICTPSIESIQAAMAPADTNYLYFLIIENGSYSNHTFSETYDEHLAAIEAAKQAQG